MPCVWACTFMFVLQSNTLPGRMHLFNFSSLWHNCMIQGKHGYETMDRLFADTVPQSVNPSCLVKPWSREYTALREKVRIKILIKSNPSNKIYDGLFGAISCVAAWLCNYIVSIINWSSMDRQLKWDNNSMPTFGTQGYCLLKVSSTEFVFPLRFLFFLPLTITYIAN